VHFALMFGIQIHLPEIQTARSVIQARLVEAPTIPPVEEPRPEPVSEPEPEPQVEPPPKEEPIAEPQPSPEPPPETVASATPPETSSNLPSVTAPLIEDPTFYPAMQVDVHPTPLHSVTPIFPDQAAKTKVSGSVVLLLLLDEGGAVKDISVEEADPPGYFEESAMAAFRDVQFAPAQRNGKVVKSRVRIKVTYDLIRTPEKPPAAPAPNRR
jgi:periplasmic protein TonB